MESIELLEHALSDPSAALIEEMSELKGDLIILGVGGKMGPSLARLAKNASQAGGSERRVIGVSRFSSPAAAQELQAAGVETIAADLMDDRALEALPHAPNVVYMAGLKFGTSSHADASWAMNAYLPGRVAEKYRDSRIVAFSTGNVYPLTSVAHGGATEQMEPGPVGEYAQSCLGRERVFEHFSRRNGTPMVLFRLNYAVEMRYGVLLEVAQAVNEGRPVDLSMGSVNVVWQGDANEWALRSLRAATSPPCLLNVTGPETVSLRWLAQCFGELLGKEPQFLHQEAETALLSNASRAHAMFGYPRVPLYRMVEWTAAWVRSGGPTLGKPTHFQEREGRF